jgi:hypothetical protein
VFQSGEELTFSVEGAPSIFLAGFYERATIPDRIDVEDDDIFISESPLSQKSLHHKLLPQPLEKSGEPKIKERADGEDKDESDSEKEDPVGGEKEEIRDGPPDESSDELIMLSERPPFLPKPHPKKILHRVEEEEVEKPHKSVQ